MKLKRILTLSLAALMLTSALVGCAPKAPAGEGDSSAAKTPEEWTEAYKTAIEGARTKEDNEGFALVTKPDELNEMVLQLLGVTAEDMTSYAIAVSAMNVQAYGIAAIMPAEGKTDAVVEGLKAFVELQKNNFNMYLMDQYDIANAAKVETLENGTVLLVMCPDQDTVFEAIKDALK